MDGNFLGIGLKNAIGLFVLFMALIIILKVGTLKYEKTPDGLRNVVQII